MAVVLAISASLPLVGPLLIRALVDRAVAGAPTDDLLPLAVAYVAVAVLAQVLALAVVWTSTALVWRITNAVRVQATEHVLSLGPGFHQHTTPGALVERVDGDLTAVSDYVANFAIKVVSALLTVVGALLVLAFIDGRLAVVLGLYAILALATFIRIRNHAVGASEAERGAYARLYGGIEEQLAGQEDLRGNGAGAHALRRFHLDAAHVLARVGDDERASLQLWHAATAAVTGGAVVALVLGAAAHGAGWISLGTALLLFQYTEVLGRPLEQVVEQLQDVQKAAGGINRVTRLMATPVEGSPRGSAVLPTGPLRVAFEAVHFSYGAEPVLAHVDLDLAPGTHVGLVGRTGGGKTTLGRLLSGLVEPDGGTVSIDGRPVTAIAPASLHRAVGVVPQEVQLFAASVRDNVTLFDRTVPDERVEAVLERVGLTERLLGRRGGLDHVLEADGAGLSAGEGQLLALARLFLRDPGVVILDEAMARVDPDTEAAVHHAMADLLTGRTALVIAHRLSTLQLVDEVAVLERGRIVERGRPELLVAEGGPYARLAHLAGSGRQDVLP
jgi:ABC-type multidrug transport system fused ATPase/permease subunit